VSSIFLSHNSKDKPFVRKLATRLSEEGVVVWLDEAVLHIGDSLIEKISEGIQDMEFVAAIISQNSIASSWVQKELSLAMSKEIKGRQVVVLPIVIDDCELPESLRDKLYADFRDVNEFETSIVKLLKAIGVIPRTAAAWSPESSHQANPTMAQDDEFTDLHIIGVDKEQTFNPDPRKAMFNVYLELSSMPPSGWDQLFAQERSFPRHTMWRRAWLEGRYIVIHCPINEVGKHHLADLKQDVASTNRKYREVLAKHLLQVAREQERQRIEEQERNNQLDSLDFS
jgi:hypothetical protein